MRRSEKEITDRQQIDEFLDGQDVIRLGMIDGSTPYIVPLNFVRIGEAIYVHSAREGRKMDILLKNPQVCFEADQLDRIIPSPTACSWGAEYTSVIGTGSAIPVEDSAEKKLVLTKLMEKHSGKDGWEIPDQAVAKTAVIRINIREVSGKHSGKSSE